MESFLSSRARHSESVYDGGIQRVESDDLRTDESLFLLDKMDLIF